MTGKGEMPGANRDVLPAVEGGFVMGKEVSRQDREGLATAVETSIAPPPEDAAKLKEECEKEFKDAIGNDPTSLTLIDFRKRTYGLMSEVITELEPLIKAPYLIRLTD